MVKHISSKVWWSETVIFLYHKHIHCYRFINLPTLRWEYSLQWCNNEHLTMFTQPFIQGPDQQKHQSSMSIAFVKGIHCWPVNSLHKGPVRRKIFPFDDVIMSQSISRLLLPKLIEHNCDVTWMSWQITCNLTVYSTVIFKPMTKKI